jgi:hypothetical protein
MPHTDFVFMQTWTTAWFPLVQGTIQEPAGLPLVFGQAGGTVGVWDVEWPSGVVVTRPLRPQKAPVRFSPLSQYF